MPQQPWELEEDILTPRPWENRQPEPLKIAVATPQGRGKAIKLNDIMAAYNIKNFEIIDFRIPTKDDYWLNNHFMVKVPVRIGRLTAKGPRLIIRRTNVGAAAGTTGYVDAGNWLRQQQQATGYGPPAGRTPER